MHFSNNLFPGILENSGLPLPPALQLSEYGHQEPSKGLGSYENLELEKQNKKVWEVEENLM